MSLFPKRPQSAPVESPQVLQWLDKLARRHETTEYPLFKVGSFTRDTTTASGNQSVTGVGFQPRTIVFLMGQSGGTTPQFSAGVDDGTTSACVYNNHNVTADTFDVDSSDAIRLQGTAGVSYEGNVLTFDADGFTVAWVRTGAPSGTITVFYLALR